METLKINIINVSKVGLIHFQPLAGKTLYRASPVLYSPIAGQFNRETASELQHMPTPPPKIYNVTQPTSVQVPWFPKDSGRCHVFCGNRGRGMQGKNG